jgi:hypothetical protein
MLIPMTHPAWNEWFDAHQFAGDIVEWEPGMTRPNPLDVWDWEVALWMIVRGYDVTATYHGSMAYNYTVGYKGHNDVLFLYRYTLPDLTIWGEPEKEEEHLEVNPEISPFLLMDYYDKQLKSHMEGIDVCTG